MPTLPFGVTLQQIDGGPNYYANNAFTYAVNAGWDNPSFFPIGPFLDVMLTQSDANRWLDLNWNAAFTITADSDLSLLRSNGISAILQANELSNFFSTLGTETVGLLTADEGEITDTMNAIGITPNNIQDGRVWWINNTWNFINFGELSGTPAPQVLSMPFTTPNGTTRHIDVQSVDIYWFAGAHSGNMVLSQGGLIDNLGRDMTPDEAARGSNYGDMIDAERAFQAGNPAPIYAFIETGGPYNEDASASDYIAPPELNWAVWSSLIHGARGVIYFNHTFAGPAQSQDNLADPFYQTIQPGQTISMYDQVKATDALVGQMAPVLHSAIASGYVTVSPAATSFNGIETAVHYYNETFYIFSDTRDSETQHNIPAVFTLNDPSATSVTVVNENRTIPVVNGSFFDTFANASTVHIYQVNNGPGAPNLTAIAAAVEASMYGVVGTSNEITALTTQFLPPQVAIAIQYGFNPLVYATEALGLAFAFGNETGSTAFATDFGPSNATMPNSIAGDVAFATAASSAIFGPASTANLVNVIETWVSNWKAFYMVFGLPGIQHASAAQIDLAARGAAWGDAIGAALSDNIGPLAGQTINFVENVTQGTAVYSASLGSQPLASNDSAVHLTGVAPHLDHATL